MKTTKEQRDNLRATGILEVFYLLDDFEELTCALAKSEAGAAVMRLALSWVEGEQNEVGSALLVRIAKLEAVMEAARDVAWGSEHSSCDPCVKTLRKELASLDDKEGDDHDDKEKK